MKTTFKFEFINRLKQPFTWFFLAFFFLIPLMTISSMGSEVTTRFSGRLLNSPAKIYQQTNLFLMMLYFVLPGIVGITLYRDFGSKMHQLLYAYPLSKKNYFFAKFLSGFSIVLMIWLGLHLGVFFGGKIPWVNPDLFGDYGLVGHLRPMLFQLPNLLLFSALVFAVVSRSRNIYAGFVAVFLFLIFGKTVNVIFQNIDNQLLAGFLDPTGVEAVRYYARYWTIEESNTSGFPLHGLVLANRLFWSGIGAAILWFAYQKFSFVHAIEGFKFGKKKIEVPTKENFKSITKVNLPRVKFNYSFLQQLRNIWTLSMSDFRFVIRDKAFLILVLAAFGAVVFMVSNGMMRFGTQDYPLTRKMLDIPLFFFSMVIDVITFLYAGLIINRARMSNMHQLTDITPIPNSTLLLSKFLALVKMQALLLSLIMIGGIVFQLSQDYFNLEIGLYLFELYVINLPHFAIWAMLAISVHTLIPNPYFGFFLLILGGIGMGAGINDIAPKLGLDFLVQGIFRYNMGVGDGMGLPYSDMAGYGPILQPYFIYKLYWGLGGCLLLVLAFLLWRRGMPAGFKERIILFKNRFSLPVMALSLPLIAGFFGLGFSIFYETNIKRPFYTDKLRKPILLAAEKKYEHFKTLQMPKITDVEMNVDIFPSKHKFIAKGQYQLVNSSNQALDTLIINYLAGCGIEYSFSRQTSITSKDTIADFGHFDILTLTESLLPGDTMQMNFTSQNPDQTWLYHDTYVKSNGTYITDDISPRLGYWLGYARRKLGMSEIKGEPNPTDTTALRETFDSNDNLARINFSATVSTDSEQTALAPGHLQKEWTENGRNYFQYKVSAPISHSYLFTSGKYAVAKEKWQDVDLEIYYFPKHKYNVDRMMEGLEDGLAYCSANFSPYQFKQVRIIEFAQVGSASAHGYPSVIPFGEEAGFVAHICDGDHGGNDFAYGGAIHEVAHMWWGHQVKPYGGGAKMVVESLPEYVNVMLKKKNRGIKKARDYMNNDIRRYLQGRNRARVEELPLAFARSDQQYVYYSKGLKVFYAMAEYIGEDKLNKAIGDYVKEVAYLEGDYTTSLDMVDHIRRATPDSLQYLIRDWYETVTLYDNRMLNFESKALDNGKYAVEMEFQVSKYRTKGQGEKIYKENGQGLVHEFGNRSVQSLPLNDYIEIGIFDEDGKELYLQKHKITEIQNKMTFVVDEKPFEGGVDPHILMIDAMMADNRM